MSAHNALASAGWHVRQFDRFDDLLHLHQLNPDRYPFLLESVANGTSHSRYDILFAFPGDSITLDAHGKQQPDFLQQLADRWQRESIKQENLTHLPFIGGWFLYFSYEFVQQIEPCLSLTAAQDSLPVAKAVRIPAAIIRDHQTQQLYLISEPAEGELVARMEQDLAALAVTELRKTHIEIVGLKEEPAEVFLNAVEKIKNYIVEGDVFQVNLSREWQAELSAGTSSCDLYQQLRLSNPAPFAALAKFGQASVISSSPERLVSQKAGIVETRPIAGTRPRGEGQQADQDNLDELIGHPKERAEHIMLIDLERNDLGRVAKPGTVEVDELMVLESYAHVHHIVSNVRAEVRDEILPTDIIRAVFPGGTITGCPKVRCMEIISELEKSSRGPYTGSLGYLNLDGSMDLNILIRTMWIEGDKVTFRAGAGIVADSIAENELQETRAKAKGMLLAITKE